MKEIKTNGLIDNKAYNNLKRIVTEANGIRDLFFIEQAGMFSFKPNSIKVDTDKVELLVNLVSEFKNKIKYDFSLKELTRETSIFLKRHNDVTDKKFGAEALLANQYLKDTMTIKFFYKISFVFDNDTKEYPFEKLLSHIVILSRIFDYISFKRNQTPEKKVKLLKKGSINGSRDNKPRKVQAKKVSTTNNRRVRKQGI